MTRIEAPKDDHTRRENVHTQPLATHRVFNNPEVLTEGWYPVCPTDELAIRSARSFVIGSQRVAIYRGADGRARALDAFCPHMGADLANGSVVDDDLRCYFHHWRFDERGALVQMGTKDKPPKKACLEAYPTAERYGWVWVYSGKVAAHPLPTAPGLEDGEVAAFCIGRTRLYAHHHVMMAGGIDLQHFATVHDLDVDFQMEVEESKAADGVADWRLTGELTADRWRTRLGRFLLGPTFAYAVRFGGASVAAITYGPGARFRGTGRRLPTLHILWGCLPQPSGVSDIVAFVLTKRRRGLLGRPIEVLLVGLTFLLLAVLKDDDVRAFPHMRFSPANLTASDRSVARFIRYVNGLRVSRWSKTLPEEGVSEPSG